MKMDKTRFRKFVVDVVGLAVESCAAEDGAIVCEVRRGRRRGTVTYDDGVVVAHCEETGREFATDWPLTARERDELLDVFCV